MLMCLTLINQYTRAVYHMNMVHFFFSDQQLTKEDREFLIKHGPIRYASDNNSPPLRYFDSATGQYKGIVIDYLQALSIELQTEITFEPMVWQEALLALKTGESDICDMYPSKERSELFLFSDPIYYQRGIILVPIEDKDTQKPLDLRGKTIAVQKGDYAHEFLNTTVGGLHYHFTKDYEESLMLLTEGKVNAIVGDEPVITYFLGLHNLSEQYRILDAPLYELPSVLSLSSDSKKLQTIINKGIYALNQKNTITKIQQKWFGISTPIGNPNQNQSLTLLLIALGGLALFIVALTLIWNFELKKAVLEQTRALKMSKKNMQTIIDGLSHLIVVVSDNWEVITANALFYDFFKLENQNDHVRLDQIILGFNGTIQSKLRDYRQTIEHIIKGRTYQLTPYAVAYEDYPGEAILLMLEDVTGKKINEYKMLQDNKMTAVGQLATGVAHEIRNPLGLIRNYVFLLKRTPNTPELLEQSLNVIESSVEKASGIIDNLLNFSRLSDDTIRSIALKPFIENVVHLNEKLMNRSKLSCHLVLEDFSMALSEEPLKHILINLINNAIDAMPSGGQITIWLKKTSTGAAIHVIDKGIGMSEETLNKLYEPFFTTKKVGDGTGLGLYIVYNEVQKMGGIVEVVSKENIGSTFKIQIKEMNEVNHEQQSI